MYHHVQRAENQKLHLANCDCYASLTLTPAMILQLCCVMPENDSNEGGHTSVIKIDNTETVNTLIGAICVKQAQSNPSVVLKSEYITLHKVYGISSPSIESI